MEATSPNEAKRSLAIARLIRPRAIAVVGASADPRSFGGFVLANLDRFGYAGAVHPVSRSSVEIGGRACVQSIAELPEGLDLAVLAIPEAGVLAAVTELAARRCAAAVLFASGYAETGAEGRERQRQITAAAGAMLIVGPNCMGFTNYEAGVAATFEPLEPYRSPGRAAIAVVAQSGAMAASLRDALIGRRLPISVVFSTGNEASVGVEDLLEHFIADEASRLIAVYAEQIRQPQRFLCLAALARTAGKPIVLLMPGRSERARSAAQSHTGALVGDHAAAVVALRREAVVVVDSLDEFYDCAAVLLRYPQPGVGGCAFVTGSGAMKNIALDFADAIALDLPVLSAATTAQLVAKLPSYAVAENPLDYTTIGVRQPGLIGEIVAILLADPAVASLVLAIPAGPLVAQRDKAEHLVPALARSSRPALLVVGGDGGPIADVLLDAIRASGVPFFRSTDRALRALAQVARYAESLQRAGREAPAPLAALNLPGALPPSGVFAEYQGKRWLAGAGIRVPRGALGASADAACAVANAIGYPVVIKAQASALPHKSEVGGVIVGLADEAALRAAWTRLVSSVQLHRPGLVLDGVLVEAMAQSGIELVIGARRDADWGPLLLVGLGGVWIEVLKDFRLIPADMPAADIVVELLRLKAAPLLQGARGAAGVDLAAVAAVVEKIGALMRADHRITEIDINPLVVSGDQVVALDVLLVCSGQDNPVFNSHPGEMT
jgi:acyl-CoA synthetase (NDP forming)